jgi:(p)ppGpp synthase/HD superfamily hydrolase
MNDTETVIAMGDIQFAMEFARRAHKGQVDKAGVDYIEHPLAVEKMVNGYEEKVAAILHDVLEDTPVTEETLRVLFGDTITNAVVALTRKPGESYMDFIHRAKRDPIARVVKLADLAHNSDLSRLLEVTQKDLDRLEKYKRAIEILNDQKLK